MSILWRLARSIGWRVALRARPARRIQPWLGVGRIEVHVDGVHEGDIAYLF